MANNFAVEFKAKRIISTSEQNIDVLSIGETVIGFVCKNRASSEQAESTYTVFNSFGWMAEVDCAACAARSLFSWHTGINPDDIHLAEAAPQTGRALIAALLAASINKDILR